MSVFVWERDLGLGLLGSHAYPWTEGMKVIPTLRRVVPRRQEKGAEMLGEPNISLRYWTFGDQPPRWDELWRYLVTTWPQGAVEVEEDY